MILLIAFLCLKVYLCSGASVNDEQFSVILETSKIKFTEQVIHTCPEAPCKDGFACIGKTCVDLCPPGTCEVNETCLYGQCYINGTFKSCEDTHCFSGQECYYNQIACLLPPCPPLPTCRSNKSDNCPERGCSSSFFCDQNTGDCVPESEISCFTVKCSKNFVCILGRCQPDPCAETVCPEGSECKNGLCEATDNCVNGKCKRGVGDCSIMRCPVRCVDGRCVSDKIDLDSCASVRCKSGTHCVNGECRVNTMDACASTLCLVNTTCFYGECFVNGSFKTCDNVSCEAGFHCEMERVDCVVATCPPVPACKPDVDNKPDRIGYNPPHKDY